MTVSWYFWPSSAGSSTSSRLASCDTMRWNAPKMRAAEEMWRLRPCLKWSSMASMPDSVTGMVTVAPAYDASGSMAVRSSSSFALSRREKCLAEASCSSERCASFICAPRRRLSCSWWFSSAFHVSWSSFCFTTFLAARERASREIWFAAAACASYGSTSGGRTKVA